MGKADTGLAQLGIAISQSGVAFSQFCVVISQVSLAISQSSLVIGQFSVTVSQFIVAFSQLSIAVSQYIFVISQFGNLIVQFSKALKKFSESINSFSREVQRFSMIMVQFSVEFRHVGATVSHLSKASNLLLQSVRNGTIPWDKVCVIMRQCSEAVCGFGVVLGEFTAILGLFTTMNTQFARVTYVQMVSKRTCNILLQYADKLRQFSIGVGRLSQAIFQFSLTCRHVTLMVQQWGVVRCHLPRPCEILPKIFLGFWDIIKLISYKFSVNAHRGCNLLLEFCSRLFLNLKRLIMKSAKFLGEILTTLGVLRENTTTDMSPELVAPRNIQIPFILIQFIGLNQFAYITFKPEEFFSLCSDFWKSKEREKNISPKNELICMKESENSVNLCVFVLCYKIQSDSYNDYRSFREVVICGESFTGLIKIFSERRNQTVRNKFESGKNNYLLNSLSSISETYVFDTEKSLSLKGFVDVICRDSSIRCDECFHNSAIKSR